MTQDEIIEMARQAGGIDISTIHGGGVRVWLGTDRTEFFETLIKLVADKKQEDIIKVIERLGTWAHIEEVVSAIRGEQA